MEPFESGFKTVNGIALYYEVYGRGPTLVLIHGGAGSIRHDFSELIARLSGSFTLVGVDLQNHGRSEHRDIPETFEQDARDVAALLSALGIGRASFLGFSNGGNTVLQVAHLFPDLPEAIVVASTFYKRSGLPEGFFDGMMLATLDHMPASLRDNFLNLINDEAKLRNMFEKDSQRMRSFIDWDDSVLASIGVPALFIAGDQDMVKPEHTAEMAGLVKDSRLMILPAGHGDYLMAGLNGQANHPQIDFAVSQISRFILGDL